MNALLGVGQGSINETFLVTIEWTGKKQTETKPLAFVAVDDMRTRPFIQTSLRNGFGKLSASFIYELLIYLQCAGVRLTTLLEMLLQAIHHIIPAEEITDDLIETILMRRQVNMEPSDEEVDLATEFVLDAFSVADQEALQKEIASCKAHTEEWTSFKRAFKAYKVAFIFRSLDFCGELIDGLSWSQMRREAGWQGIQFLLSSSGSSSLNVNSFSFIVLQLTVLLSDPHVEPGSRKRCYLRNC